MKHTMTAVTRFELGGGFYAEVIPQGGEVAFWLGHKDADIKEKMFAMSAELAPDDQWEILLRDNAEDYMEDFREGWLED